MPTGYTYDIVNGKLQDFNEFAMRCARAFGALINMRDAPSDAPIPEKFESSVYHKNAADEARKEKKRLAALAPPELETECAAAFHEKVEQEQKWRRELILENQRCQDMAAKVKGWTAPTPDHEELKSFMLQQLKISVYVEREAETFMRPSPEDWLLEKLQKCRHDIEYHDKEHAKEIERTKSRNEWLRVLRVSLEGNSND